MLQILVSTSGIGHHIEVAIIDFVHNGIVNDASPFIGQDSVASSVVLQRLDIGHCDVLQEGTSLTTSHRQLQRKAGEGKTHSSYCNTTKKTQSRVGYNKERSHSDHSKCAYVIGLHRMQKPVSFGSTIFP